MDIKSPVTGTVWQHCVSVGQNVVAGSEIITLESMKMELSIMISCDGRVSWLKPMGEPVEEGDLIAVVDESAT